MKKIEGEKSKKKKWRSNNVKSEGETNHENENGMGLAS